MSGTDLALRTGVPKSMEIAIQVVGDRLGEPLRDGGQRLVDAIATIMVVAFACKAIAAWLLAPDAPGLAVFDASISLAGGGVLVLRRLGHDLPARITLLMILLLGVSSASLLLGRESGAHHCALGVAAFSWLVVPEELRPLAWCGTAASAMVFAAAELAAPAVGPLITPALVPALKVSCFVLAFTLVGVALAISTHTSAEARAQLARLAARDSLTGAVNHAGFLSAARTELARVRRGGGPASVVMLDLDHFKQVNDRWGHAVGDSVLRHVAALLVDATRVSDVIGRVGGEEFALLLPDTDLDGAAILAERLRHRVRSEPIVFRDRCVAVTVSIGVATLRPDDPTAEAGLARADAALYASKRAGRDRTSLAPEEPAAVPPRRRPPMETLPPPAREAPAPRSAATVFDGPGDAADARLLAR